jgi:hypothetical protein
MEKLPKAYFLSHNGLGDNITSIGAINFLSQYYDVIYFLCKDIYESNVKLLFENNKCVVVLPVDNKNEFNRCKEILDNAHKQDENVNIFVCGCHTIYAKSIITHPELINYQKTKKYETDYIHINKFYDDINLDLTIYYEYFDIESSEISKELYKNIENYNIIFMHTKSSTHDINLHDIIDKFINDDTYLIICANKNVYSEDDLKYNSANKFVNIPLQHYIDTIKNSKEIHVVNSCFSCIVYPLYKTNRLPDSNVNIISRIT